MPVKVKPVDPDKPEEKIKTSDFVRRTMVAYRAGMNLPEHLPEDIEAERALLSTLAASGNEAMARMEMPKLTHADFMHPAHKAIFESLKSVLAAREEVTPITLKHHLSIRNELGLVGGFPGLLDILNEHEVSKPDRLIEILHEKRMARQLIQLSGKLLSASQSAQENPLDLINRAQETLRHIAIGATQSRSFKGLDILHKMSSFEPIRYGEDDVGGYWGTPFLDRWAPIPCGEFAVFRGRPGTGKSTGMSQSMVASARKGKRVLGITLEMRKEKLESRIAAYITGKNFSDLARGSYTADDVLSMGEDTPALSLLHYLDPLPHTPWSQIEAAIRYEVERNGIQYVVLDQFDKIGRPDIAKGSTEAYAFGKVSECLTSLVKDLNIGFLLLQQLKAGAEGKEPDLADGADSDRPGKDAGVVVDMWKHGEKRKVKVQKSRNSGGTDKVCTLEFDGGKQRMWESETDSQEYSLKPKL